MPTLTMRVRSKLTCLFLHLAGRWYLIRDRRSGSFERARRLFQAVLELDGRSFSAHLFLGQMARREGQARLAFKHYLAACEASPTRFNRSALPDDLKNHVALRHALSYSPRVAAIPCHENKVDRGETDHLLEGLNSLEDTFAEAMPQAAGIADFASMEEVQRFANRPPITAEEIENTDLDHLMQRLLSED